MSLPVLRYPIEGKEKKRTNRSDNETYRTTGDKPFKKKMKIALI
ncbi:hypothetical protein SPHINGO8BC_90191 [Sphingobacterium multivorum]|uniref:Uncharacterized protein n=1 Tax=Sphingobacterium multivorum TaxID=28454 RepID=A0A654DPZ3_SPHMU|nr:hypothetical protein SPHINGO8BC_90191 [Sphingobacterium multivorum]